jgi:glycosyltransferase involved in cell wall biosynthesis
MIEYPLVSVFCLCYNQSRYVIESLESIKNQTYPNIEIFIIDDYSQKDNSVEVIDNWIKVNKQLNITFIKHQQNIGICKSLNELLNLSTGKYLQLVALDDVLKPWKLEKHVEILENSNENDALIFSDAYLMDDNSILYQNRFIGLHKKYLSLKSGNYFDELINGNFIPALTVMFKANIIKNIGGWDSNLLYEDYDMWLCLSSKGYDFIFCDKPSCIYRLHNQNTHKNTSLFGAPTFQIFFKFSNFPKVQKILKKNLETAYRSNNLTAENKLYFSKFKAEKLSDYFIKYNLPIFGFRVLRFFRL